MKAASSLVRNDSVPIRSSGTRPRLIGRRLEFVAGRGAGPPPASAGAGRAHQAGRNGIDCDAVLAELARERAREADDAALAGDVVGEAREIGEEGIGRHVDDPSPASPPHAGGERLDGEELRIEIDRHQPPPVRERHLVEHLDGIDAGIVDEDVAAAELCLHGLRERRDLRGLADVAAHRHGGTSGGLHQPDGRITVLRIGHDHLGAVVRQPPRIGLADARGRSGDDGDLADMAACHPAPPCHSARRARPPEQIVPRKTGWLNLMMLGHNRKMSGAECLSAMLVL